MRTPDRRLTVAYLPLQGLNKAQQTSEARPNQSLLANARPTENPSEGALFQFANQLLGESAIDLT
jgi:hypothetical protein